MMVSFDEITTVLRDCLSRYQVCGSISGWQCRVNQSATAQPRQYPKAQYVAIYRRYWRGTRKRYTMTTMTPENLLELPLNADGSVSHWLACGPILSPLTQIGAVVPANGPAFGTGRRWILSYWAFHPASRALKAAVYARLPLPSPPSTPPVVNQPGPDTHPWRYTVVEDDQVVDFSRFNYTPRRLQGWLYSGLVCNQALTVDAELITIGPARVWLDGTEQIHVVEFSYVAPLVIPLRLTLDAGRHDLFIHGDMIGWREARLALGLRFIGTPPLRTTLALGPQSPERWQQAERALAYIQVKQFAVPDLHGVLGLSATAPEPVIVDLDVRIAHSIFAPSGVQLMAVPSARARHTLLPGETVALPLSGKMADEATQLPESNLVTLTIRPADGPFGLERHLWINAAPYSMERYGDYESRRHEALVHLALNRQHVIGHMAAVALGRAETINSDAVALSCEFLEQRFDCADFHALALLALLYRLGEHPALHPEDRNRIERAFEGFKYWIDEPGLDGMCYITENHQILFHVTAYLAGQMWPERIFTNSGYTGRRHMQRARPRITTWVQRRLQGGFSEWDSNTYLAMDIFAMLALAEFANSARLREIATTLLHKILFIIASHSFRGAHGSTHGRCYVEGLKTARADATSGVQRIAWGMGNFNDEVYATGMLALARHYRVPDILQEIGADLPPVLVTHARSRGRYRPQFDIHRGEWDVRTITRRTPYTMLSAAIDHRPDQIGIQEHLWQATLAPEAVVFTTYPGNSQEHGNARPNFWAGSVRLPRIAMWDRTVIVLYHLQTDVGLGFSHAYFPTIAFDEYTVAGQWACARYGEGYVALWSDGSLHLTELGRHAGQELRSASGGNAWVCTVGSAVDDGDFNTFCARVRTQSPMLEKDTLTCRGLAGELFQFGWSGPLRVDDTPEDWDHFPHYKNHYTHTELGDEQMIVRQGDRALALDLRHGRVLNR